MKRFVAIFLTLSLGFSLLSGCGDKPAEPQATAQAVHMSVDEYKALAKELSDETHKWSDEINTSVVADTKPSLDTWRYHQSRNAQIAVLRAKVDDTISKMYEDLQSGSLDKATYDDLSQQLQLLSDTLGSIANAANIMFAIATENGAPNDDTAPK